jgi:hypothetical protein
VIGFAATFSVHTFLNAREGSVVDSLIDGFVKFVVFFVKALPAVVFCVGGICYLLSLGHTESLSNGKQ